MLPCKSNSFWGRAVQPVFYRAGVAARQRKGRFANLRQMAQELLTAGAVGVGCGFPYSALLVGVAKAFSLAVISITLAGGGK